MKSSQFRRWTWRVHKFLSYIILLQIFFWVAGGLLFAMLPFDAWVKGKEFVEPPAPIALSKNSLNALALLEQEINGVSAHQSAQGTLLELSTVTGFLWLNEVGVEAPQANPEQIENFGRGLLKQEPRNIEVTWLSEPEFRVMGLVDELYGQSGLWKMDVDNHYRLYFSPEGKYLKVRTNYWVWFDALWRLHIMDYGNGENFNNLLLRIFSWIAMVFVISGIVLSVFAAQRNIKKSKKKSDLVIRAC